MRREKREERRKKSEERREKREERGEKGENPVHPKLKFVHTKVEVAFGTPSSILDISWDAHADSPRWWIVSPYQNACVTFHVLKNARPSPLTSNNILMIVNSCHQK